MNTFISSPSDVDRQEHRCALPKEPPYFQRGAILMCGDCYRHWVVRYDEHGGPHWVPMRWYHREAWRWFWSARW